MDSDHFQSQMNRLSSRWPKAHPAEFMILLWRECKSLPNGWLTKTVDELIGSSRLAPLMPDFRTHISSEREKMHSGSRASETHSNWNAYPACECCKDNGTYVARRRDEQGGFYAFRCHCEKGFADIRQHIPQFKSDHAKDYVYFDITEHRRRMATV